MQMKQYFGQLDENLTGASKYFVISIKSVQGEKKLHHLTRLEE